jgi:hypothetical protein
VVGLPVAVVGEEGAARSTPNPRHQAAASKREEGVLAV